MAKKFESNIQTLEFSGTNINLTVTYLKDRLGILVSDNHNKIGVILADWEVQELSDFLNEFLSSRKDYKLRLV